MSQNKITDLNSMTEDDTFERLRRPSYSELEARMLKESTYHGRLIYTVDPESFEPRILRGLSHIIEEMGWTVDEVNEHLNKKYRT